MTPIGRPDLTQFGYQLPKTNVELTIFFNGIIRPVLACIHLGLAPYNQNNHPTLVLIISPPHPFLPFADCSSSNKKPAAIFPCLFPPWLRGYFTPKLNHVYDTKISWCIFVWGKFLTYLTKLHVKIIIRSNCFFFALGVVTFKSVQHSISLDKMASAGVPCKISL